MTQFWLSYKLNSSALKHLILFVCFLFMAPHNKVDTFWLFLKPTVGEKFPYVEKNRETEICIFEKF